jgi:hypothetical protein
MREEHTVMPSAIGSRGTIDGFSLVVCNENQASPRRAHHLPKWGEPKTDREIRVFAVEQKMSDYPPVRTQWLCDARSNVIQGRSRS